jgi:hypothetical protein
MLLRQDKVQTKEQESILAQIMQEFSVYRQSAGNSAGFPRFVPLDFLNTVPLLNA